MWILGASLWHNLSVSGLARLGWRSPLGLSSGVERGLFQVPLATKQGTATTEVRLCDGHQGTKLTTTIAVESGLRECLPIQALA